MAGALPFGSASRLGGSNPADRSRSFHSDAHARIARFFAGPSDQLLLAPNAPARRGRGHAKRGRAGGSGTKLAPAGRRGCGGTDDLSLACQTRRDLVRAAFETGIRARSLAEVEMRQRCLVEGESEIDGIERAVLKDLQHLIRQQNAAEQPRRKVAPRRAQMAVGDLFDTVQRDLEE